MYLRAFSGALSGIAVIIQALLLAGLNSKAFTVIQRGYLLSFLTMVFLILKGKSGEGPSQVRARPSVKWTVIAAFGLWVAYSALLAISEMREGFSLTTGMLFKLWVSAGYSWIFAVLAAL